MTNDEYRIQCLEVVIDRYDRAAKKFINKVDNGEARSVETYRDLKEALKLSEQYK